MSVVFEVLATLFWLIPWIPILVAVVGGLIAIAKLGRPPRRDREDRGDAMGIAVIMAILVGIAGFFDLVPAIFHVDATPFIVITGAGALLVAGVGYLAAIGGYALLARPGVGRRALAGAIVVPLLFATSTLVLRPLAASLEDAARRSATTERAHEVGLVLTIEALEVTMAPARDTATNLDIDAVDGVTMTITIRTDIELGPTYLRLYRPSYPFGTPFFSESVDKLDAGTANWRAATFRKVSESGYLRDPGEWMLELYTQDALRHVYRVLTPLTLGAS